MALPSPFFSPLFLLLLPHIVSWRSLRQDYNLSSNKSTWCYHNGNNKLLRDQSYCPQTWGINPLWKAGPSRSQRAMQTFTDPVCEDITAGIALLGNPTVGLPFPCISARLLEVGVASETAFLFKSKCLSQLLSETVTFSWAFTFAYYRLCKKYSKPRELKQLHSKKSKFGLYDL